MYRAGVAVDAPLLFDRRPSAIAYRPALPIAILLIAGISLLQWFAPSIAVWTAIAAGILCSAIMFHRHAALSSVCIALATFLLGVALAQCVERRYSQNDIGNFASDEPALEQVRFEIDHAPTLVYPPSIAGRTSPPKQVIIGRAVAVHGQSKWIDADGELLVQLSHPNPWLALGQTVEGIGLLGHPLPASNPGQIDWAEVNRQRGILATFEINRSDNVQILQDAGVGPIGWLRQESRHLLSTGFTAHRMADYALLRALTLGDSDPDSRDVQDAFAQVGLAYQLAISGMHIVVLVGCAYLICRLCRCSPRLSIGICISVVLLYGIIALPTTSARRAVFMCIAVLAAPLWSRNGDKLQLLSLAAIGLAVIDPMDLRSAGFQLGFVTVLGLTVFAPGLLRADQFESSNRTTSRWQRIRRQIFLSVRAWLILSAVAWIVSLPLVAFHFGQINPWAVGLGIFIFPLVVVSLLGGWAKMILTLLWPSIASVAARASEVPVYAMRLIALKLTHLPSASIAITPPSIGIILIYYVLLLVTLLPFKRLWMRQTSRIAAACGIAGFLLLITGHFSAAFEAIPDELTVTLLNVGAGQCAVVEAPGDSGVTLIDCGSDSIADVAKSVLLPALQTMHERNIARVFLSHSDYDHISALSSIISMVSGPVYTSEYFAKFAERDPPAAALLHKLDSLNHPPTILRAGDHVQVGPRAFVDVLWPTDGSTFNVNDTGLVLRLTYAGRSILFPADIEANAMRALHGIGNALHADVLVAAHHGSSEVTTKSFLDEVAPRYVVASNAANLTGKQRHFDELIGSELPLFRTSRFGAVTIHVSSDSKITVSTFKAMPTTQPQQ